MKYYFKCPNCQSDERFTLPVEASSSFGCLLFIFGGFLPALLYAAHSVRQRVQCANCGFIFRQPPLPRSRVSIWATWIIGVLVVFAILTLLMLLFPEITTLMPEHPWISELEAAIVENPKAVVFGMIPMMALLLMISLVASFSSNLKAHRELRKEYETKPKPFSEPKPQPDAMQTAAPIPNP